MITTLLIIIVLIFNFYVTGLFIYELYQLLKWYFNKHYIYWDKKHSIQHIEYISIYIIFLLWFFGWLFIHWWINHWVNEHLVWEHLYLILYVMWLSNLWLLKHIRQERLDTKILGR